MTSVLGDLVSFPTRRSSDLVRSRMPALIVTVPVLLKATPVVATRNWVVPVPCWVRAAEYVNELESRVPILCRLDRALAVKVPLLTQVPLFIGRVSALQVAVL